MVRLLCLVMCLSSFSNALAAIRPGPPPWTCGVIEACNEQNVCVPVHGLPLSFKLFDLTGEETRFSFSEDGDTRHIAVVYPTLEEARRRVPGDMRRDQVITVLIRYEQVYDAVGFLAYGSTTHRTGERVVGPDRMLIVCGS